MDVYPRRPYPPMESEANAWRQYGTGTRLLASNALPPHFPNSSDMDASLSSVPINGRLWGLRQDEDAAIEALHSLGPETTPWPAPDAALLQAKRAPAFLLSTRGPSGEGIPMRYIPHHSQGAEGHPLELNIQHEQEQLRLQERMVMHLGELERDWQRMLEVRRFRQDGQLAFQRQAQLGGRAQRLQDLEQQEHHQRGVPHPHGYPAERFAADTFGPPRYEQPRFNGHQEMAHLPDHPANWPRDESHQAMSKRWHSAGYDEHCFNDDQFRQRPDVRLHGDMRDTEAFRMDRHAEGGAQVPVQPFGVLQQPWRPSRPMPQQDALSSHELVAVSLLSLKGAPGPCKGPAAFESSDIGMVGRRSANDVKKGRSKLEDCMKWAPRAAPKKQICRVIGCGKLDKGRGLCKLHGGGNRCRYPDCDNASRGSSGLCIRHGGGPRCLVPHCPKSARTVGGFCKMHGGGRKCDVEKCKRSARGEGLYCAEHTEIFSPAPAQAAATGSTGKDPDAPVARNYSVYPSDATVPQSPVTDDDTHSSSSSSFSHSRLGEAAKPSAVLKRSHP